MINFMKLPRCFIPGEYYETRQLKQVYSMLRTQVGWKFGTQDCRSRLCTDYHQLN